VLHVGNVVNAVLVSLFTQPVIVALSVGAVSPYVTVGDGAVTVKVFLAMLITPAVKVKE
jgi:hypothetical protein